MCQAYLKISDVSKTASLTATLVLELPVLGREVLDELVLSLAELVLAP